MLPSSSGHLDETWVFHRTLDQVKEDVRQAQFLTNVVSPFRVRGQNPVAQALQRLEETHSFNFPTCQLGKNRNNQCVINGFMAAWVYVQVKGVLLVLSTPAVWTSAEEGCCWGSLVPSVDCWDPNLGSLSPKIPHYLHSEGARHGFKTTTTSEASLVFFTDLTAPPHQSWSDLDRGKLTVVVDTDLTSVHDKKEVVFIPDLI